MLKQIKEITIYKPPYKLIKLLNEYLNCVNVEDKKQILNTIQNSNVKYKKTGSYEFLPIKKPSTNR